MELPNVTQESERPIVIVQVIISRFLRYTDSSFTPRRQKHLLATAHRAVHPSLSNLSGRCIVRQDKHGLIVGFQAAQLTAGKGLDRRRGWIREVLGDEIIGAFGHAAYGACLSPKLGNPPLRLVFYPYCRPDEPAT
jgi:hypothetical protein